MTEVDGTTVDLDEPAPAGGALQIALVADNDDTSVVEHAVMRHTGFGGAEGFFDVFFDPWSQVAYRGKLPGNPDPVIAGLLR